MPRRGGEAPTTPDLVVLSLLAERPMHGYELNRELIRRDVDDWARISRAQVYYSIKKSLSRGWLVPTSTGATPAGPERQEVETSERGLQILAEALEAESWATQRGVPPFQTWLALSHHATRDALHSGLARRRQFLLGELARERETLRAISAEEDAMTTAAELMVALAIRQFELELDWLDDVEARLFGED